MPKGRYEEGHFRRIKMVDKEEITAQGKPVGEDGLTHSDPIQTDFGGVALPGMNAFDNTMDEDLRELEEDRKKHGPEYGRAKQKGKIIPLESKTYPPGPPSVPNKCARCGHEAVEHRGVTTVSLTMCKLCGCHTFVSSVG